MGASSSTLRGVVNDFEMVTRASKSLEKSFCDDFGLQGLPLSQQIVRMEHELSDNIITDMKELVHMRNKLVHDSDVNCLEDVHSSRSDFLNRFERAHQALEHLKYTKERRASAYNGLTVANSMHRSGNNGSSVSGNEGNSWGTAAVIGMGALAVLAIASAAEDSEERRKKKSWS